VEKSDDHPPLKADHPHRLMYGTDRIMHKFQSRKQEGAIEACLVKWQVFRLGATPADGQSVGLTSPFLSHRGGRLNG
jgi:hypothetical protein